MTIIFVLKKRYDYVFNDQNTFKSNLVAICLHSFSMDAVTKSNTATSFAEDLQEAVELTINRLKILQLTKCTLIDVDRIELVLQIMVQCYCSE